MKWMKKLGSGELSEDALESVSGVMDFDTFKKNAGTVSYVEAHWYV